jgi:tetratricopeptide (TPR) repeat protein
VLALCLVASPGWSQRYDRREHARLLREAAAQYEAGNAPACVQALRRAYAIHPSPGILYNLGRAHDLSRDYPSAVDYYEQYLATHPAAQDAAVAQEALNASRRRVAEAQEAERLRLEEAERQAREARERQAAQERQRQELLLRRRTPHPVRRRVTAPIGALWIGAGVSLLAGAALGTLALLDQDSFSQTRQGVDRATLYERGTALALGTDIALGTGLVAGALGLVLYLLQPTTAVEGP